MFQRSDAASESTVHSTIFTMQQQIKPPRKPQAEGRRSEAKRSKPHLKMFRIQWLTSVWHVCGLPQLYPLIYC